MALLTCPDCGEAVSTDAASCPSCGRRTKRGARFVQSISLWEWGIGIAVGLAVCFALFTIAAGMS